MSENEQCLQALEAEASGDWEKAHRLVQDGDSPASAWVHAYLHRVEGDVGNAGYWYRRAGKPAGEGDFAAERERIRQALRG